MPWLADYARRYCTEQFRVSRAAHVPGLTFAMLVPTDREWNAWNDQVSPGRQEVLCVAWQQNRSTLDKSLVAG